MGKRTKAKRRRITVTERCFGCFHDDCDGWKLACYTCRRMPVAQRRVVDRYTRR